MLILISVPGCKDEDDEGTPANTLVVNGSNVAMSSVVCTQHGSGFLLEITASDLAMSNVLELHVRNIPTSEVTLTFSTSSAAEIWGLYTVNSNVEYYFQSGTATIKPLTATTYSVTFENVPALAAGTVEATVSFNGACN